MNNIVYITLYKGPPRYKGFHSIIDIVSNYGIKLITKGKVSHCEAVINGLSYSSSFMDKGVRDKVIDYDGKRWIVYETDLDAKEVLKIFEELKELGYDTKGAASFALKFIKQEKHKIFCSELIALFCNIPNKLLSNLLNKQAHECSPEDIRKYCEARGFRKITKQEDITRLLSYRAPI